MNLGIIIKKLRNKKGILQKDFAERCNVTQAYISQIENNEKEPHIGTLKTIALQLEVPVPILMFLTLGPEDIDREKLLAFNIISPSVNAFIKEFFDIEI